MIVAARASHGQAHEHVGGGIHAVGHILHLILFGNRAAFVVDDVVAIKSAGQFLLDGGVGDQVAGQLLDAEAVERHVAIEGVDHPLAPLPHTALGIDVVAVSVGIARQIEPLHRHALAELRQGQQAVHLLLIGVGGFVGEEGVYFGGCGRQAGEVEAQASQQGGAVGLGGGLEPLAFEALQHQAIDRIARPLLITDGGHRGALRRHERPVPLPLGALLDPFAHGGDLRFGERGARLLRRHAAGRRSGADAPQESALRGVARRDDAIAAAVGEQALLGIEAQVRHAMLVVGPVAGETVVGQNRTDVPIEIDQRSGGEGPPHRSQTQEQTN